MSYFDRKVPPVTTEAQAECAVDIKRPGRTTIAPYYALVTNDCGRSAVCVYMDEIRETAVFDGLGEPDWAYAINHDDPNDLVRFCREQIEQYIEWDEKLGDDR